MTRNLVLSVGMPRAGSGWAYNLTHDLVVAGGGTDARAIRTKYRLSPFLTQVNCNMGSLDFYRLIPVLFPLLLEGRYVIKLHGGRKPFASIMIQSGLIKPTYIYRDPRDALLSAYEYGERMRSQGKSNAFTPLTTMEEAIDFMAAYVEIAQDWLSCSHAYHMKYEDLLLDYEGTVSELIEFLGLTLDEGAKKEVIRRYRPEQGSRDQRGTHFVKGKIGRYREVFTPFQREICRAKFGDFLEAQGYTLR